MWRSREKFAPEFWYCVAAFAVVGPIIPSAARYIMAYQPFLWIFFYAGMTVLLRRSRRAVSNSRILFAALALIVITTGAVVYLRAERTRWHREAIVLQRSRRRHASYVSEVAWTFRGLRNFLETLPRDHTLLISEPERMAAGKRSRASTTIVRTPRFTWQSPNRDTYLS